MVFGEIPLAGSSSKSENNVTTMTFSFTGNRSVDFMLVQGKGTKVQGVRTSDDSPLTLNAQKFKQANNKVTFNALAKHIEITFPAPPMLDRIAFYGEIPDSDAYIRQTFSEKEVKAAQKDGKVVKAKPVKKKAKPKGDSNPAEVKVKFKPGQKRGTAGHIDTLQAQKKLNPIPPGAITINPPRVPPKRADDEDEDDDGHEDDNRKK